MSKAGGALPRPKNAFAGDPTAARILSVLRHGWRLDDETFDAIYEPRLQLISSLHWTPLDDASVAVRWLTESGARRVLDVGAGVGKLCLYGALTTEHVVYAGIEHRAHLAEAAMRAANRLGVAARVDIRVGSLETIDPHEFDAFYLYNPFGENLIDDPDDVIDRTIDLSRDRYAHDVGIIEGWLERIRPGTRIVTLHGFGGEFHPRLRPLASRRTGWDVLRLWETQT